MCHSFYVVLIKVCASIIEVNIMFLKKEEKKSKLKQSMKERKIQDNLIVMDPIIILPLRTWHVSLFLCSFDRKRKMPIKSIKMKIATVRIN